MVNRSHFRDTPFILNSALASHAGPVCVPVPPPNLLQLEGSEYFVGDSVQEHRGILRYGTFLDPLLLRLPLAHL